MNDTNHNIAQKIKYYRKLQGMTQKDVASKVGVTYQQIQKYESGKDNLSINRLIQICNTLKVSTTTLLADVQENSSTDINNLKLTADTVKLINTYQSIPNKQKKTVLMLIQELYKK